MAGGGLNDAKLIGVIGRAGAGKDTFAAGFPHHVNVKMAGPLKAMCAELFRVFDVDPIVLECPRRKNKPLAALGGRTPRYIMQTLGTEWGRETISPDLWTDAFCAQVAKHDKVICTDIRFHNEAELIKSLGGILVCVNADERLGPLESAHSSETELQQIETDVTVYNNGSEAEFTRL